MAKATKEEKQGFLKNYSQCQVEFAKYMDEFRNKLFITVANHDFETDMDIKEFAKEAYYIKAKEFIDQKHFEYTELASALRYLNDNDL